MILDQLTIDGQLYQRVPLADLIEFEGKYEPAEVAAQIRISVKRDALEKIKQAHANFLRALTGNETTEERDTWPEKASAAKAILDGVADQSQIELLQDEAEMRKQSVEEFAQHVRNKNLAYRELVQKASAIRRFGKNQLDALIQSDIEAMDLPNQVANLLSELESKASLAIVEWRKNNE